MGLGDVVALVLASSAGALGARSAMGARMGSGARAVVGLVLVVVAMAGGVAAVLLLLVPGGKLLAYAALGLSLGCVWGLGGWAVRAVWSSRVVDGGPVEWRGLRSRYAGAVAGVVAIAVVWGWSQWGDGGGGAEGARGQAVPVAAVQSPAAPGGGGCDCADGGRCTGPKGGVFCRKPDGTKRYY